jgi:hypothetical protein
VCTNHHNHSRTDDHGSTDDHGCADDNDRRAVSYRFLLVDV